MPGRKPPEILDVAGGVFIRWQDTKSLAGYEKHYRLPFGPR